MADRHLNQWRPTLRPDKALFKRVAGKLHAAGRNMNDEFGRWLLWMDGETDEYPPRPTADSGDEG
jgi:hypothetical protein